jgi:predicted nuclease of restriction endonuclease-like (RecB) superfamily
MTEQNDENGKKTDFDSNGENSGAGVSSGELVPDATSLTNTALTSGTVNGDLELLPSAEETLVRIRQILTQARHKAWQSVNVTMVQAYWDVGREIVEEEQLGKERAGYGTQLLKTLAARLTKDFGNGYRMRNLAYMRDFYLTYPILHAVRAELSWTHYRLLLSVEKLEARQFYEAEAIRASWSTRELDRQIHSSLYERLALSRDVEGTLRLAGQGAEAAKPEDIIRDPFVMEFTGLESRDVFAESDLESALMNRLQEFLLELGTDFFFVARQKRLLMDNEWSKVDMVFYHRTLRCFVLIDLKMDKITPQDIGQMLSYVGYYAANEQREGENPPIGILLGAGKSDAAVKYALSGTTQQIFAARYQLHLPTEEELLQALVKQRDTLLLERKLDAESSKAEETS